MFTIYFYYLRKIKQNNYIIQILKGKNIIFEYKKKQLNMNR